jgi:hypothetical protein
MSDVSDVLDAVELFAAQHRKRMAGLAEGFCTEHGQRLAPTRLHADNTGPDFGACLTCQCSWRLIDGVSWVSCCIPGQHTCGRTKDLCL